MFGGSPSLRTPYDFIVAVKTSGATPTLSGIYYQAGFDNNNGDLDSYFGSFNMIPGGSPQNYLGHQRINDYAGSSVYDYTYYEHAQALRQRLRHLRRASSPAPAGIRDYLWDRALSSDSA